VNEWGLPDWRDAAAYGDVDAWPVYRWRWEFLRRREDYRTDFDRLAGQTYEREKAARCNIRGTPQEIAYLKAKFASMGPPLTPDQPGFSALDFDDEYLSLYRKYATSGLLNPRTSDQPDNLLRRFDTAGAEIPYRVGRSTATLHGKPIDSLPIWAGQMAILFDLERPLPEQIESARKLLRNAQNDFCGKHVQKRPRPDKWLTYLRVLDARESGATWAEAATILATGSKNVQSARDTWTQARSCGFNFSF